MPSTKQLLDNFLGRFFRKAIFGARVKNGLLIKKRVYLEIFGNFSVT